MCIYNPLVDAVTANELHTLINKMLREKVTMAGFGRLDKWPSLIDVQEKVWAPLKTPGKGGIFSSIFKPFR